MREKGLVTKNGLSIQKGHFFRLIRNPVYKGVIKKFGETHKGTFDPIIPEKLFDEVQAILKGRSNKTKTYFHDNPDFPLRGFVVNDDGKQMTGYWSKGKYKKYPYYSFQMPGTAIRKERLEKSFLDFMAKYTFDATHLNVMKENLMAHFGKKANGYQNDRDAVRNQINELNKKIDNLIELQGQGSISLNSFNDRVKRLEIELEDLTVLLENTPIDKINIPELMQFAAKALKEPAALWFTSPLNIRQLLQKFDFPNGVVFDGIRFRTPKVCSIYKLKEQIDAGKFLRVESKELKINTYSNDNLPYCAKSLLDTKVFWEEIVAELQGLKRIVQENSVQTINYPTIDNTVDG